MRRARGYILVLTIMVIGALFFMAIQYVNLVRAERSLAGQGEADLVAKAAADAGVDAAIYQLEGNAGWTAGFNRVPLPHSGAAYRVTFTSAGPDVPWSTNNSGGSAPVVGYNARVVPPGGIHVVSLGEFGAARRIEECLLTGGSSPFRGASFVETTVSLTGNAHTDSYDSSRGTYAQTHEDRYGDVGTNQGSAATVSMVGNAVVNGNVAVGPGGSQASINGVEGRSYQSWSALSEVVQMPAPSATPAPNPVDVTVTGGGGGKAGASPTPLAPGTYRNFRTGANGVVALSAGRYVFTGDFDMSGGGQLVLPTGGGPVEILVLGSTISLTGTSTSNATLKPSNLVMYGGGATTTVRISGNGDGTFALYAPRADIAVNGNGEIYGSIVGRSLTMVGNGAIHFDRDLRRFAAPTAGLAVRARW